MSKERRVVITGIGPVASPGIGKEAFWDGLLKKRVGLNIKEIELDEKLWERFYVHKVKDFDFTKFNVDTTALIYMKEWKEEEPPIDLYYLLAAIALALEDSGIEYSYESNTEMGVVLTHENMGLMPFLLKLSQISYDTLNGNKSQSFSRKQFYEKLYRDCLKSGYDIQTFMTLFHVTKAFNVHSYSLFINNACASGLYALESAAQMIKCNQNSVVVVAASDYSEIYKYLWFRDIGLYSSDGKVRPFCKDSNGLVFGDGGIGIVMEDLEHAQERNASIYAEYLGGGFYLEGWKVTTPQIGSDSYQKAILKALKQSNISKDEVELLCPHGVGSQTIDYYESKAITDVFGLNPEKPLITTFKPYVGHNLGGSALLEAAILLLSLEKELVLPTLNCENLDPKFNISLVQKELRTKINTAMKICCAFAGYNAAVIFKRLE
jgi:3-oxoacyl-[acyl-carrier-protein] synthase II